MTQKISVYEAIVCLKTREEVRMFLRDLCTPGEMKDMEERWQIAQLLYQGDLSYRDIASKTGASTTTIARVSRFLKQEPYKGYQLVLDRLSGKK